MFGTTTSCLIKVFETGLLYADAVVNGFTETDSVEIYALCSTGDTALDNNPAAREAILQLLGKEWRNADPNDSVTANRREQMGVVYRDPATGNTDEWMNPDQQSDSGDACNSFLGSGPGAGINPVTDYKYFVHVHPFAPWDHTPSTNCKNHDPGGEYVPGPSPADKDFIGDGIDHDEIPPSTQGIVMDSTYIYRFDRHGTIKKTPRYNASARCRVI